MADQVVLALLEPARQRPGAELAKVDGGSAIVADAHAALCFFEMPQGRPSLGGLAARGLALGVGTGGLPDADRLIPVRSRQPAAVGAEDQARVEGRVAEPRRGAAQGEQLLTGAHVPQLHPVAADAGQAAAVGAEGQVAQQLGYS